MAKSVVSYGVYVPFLRIKRDEYLIALGSCGADMKEKAVMDIDEDVITMAVEAARDATAGLDTGGIGVLALASANFPYQEKVMAGTMVEALGLNNDVLTSHHGNSTLAGSEAFLAAMGLLDQTDRKYALVVISDAPAAGVSEDMDHGLGAGSCAFVLAKDGPGLEFGGVYAYSGEYMGLRYRLPGETEIRDIGVRAYSSMAFNEAARSSVAGLLAKLGRVPGDYRHIVLPQADVKASLALAGKMGFSEEQLREGLVFDRVGDTGACSPFLGLCSVLDCAAPGDKIIVCSYGAGGGSHALSFNLSVPPQKRKAVRDLLDRKRYINYIHYLKLKKII
ncbi:MAG: 3-oxoacyl-[acyl-carrier-protein] synthase III C-terminal domain-containing protein [Bacillota bacterium]